MQDRPRPHGGEGAGHAQRARDRTILDSLREGVLMFDADGRVLTSNSAVEALFDAPAEYLAGRSHEEMVAAIEANGGGVEDEEGAEFPMAEHPIVLARNSGESVSNVLMGIRRRAHSTPAWFQVSARPLVELGAGPPYAVVVSFSDVTEIRRAEVERDGLVMALARERRFLGAALSSIGEGIMACDADGRVTVFNEAARLFLRPAAEPIGKPPAVDVLQRADGRPLSAEEHPLLVALAGGRVVAMELIAAPVDGERRNLLVNGSLLRASAGEELGAVIALHDATDQKRLESELTALALHDPLTGLANRILLSDRLEVAFDRGIRENTGVGLLLLDLDDFKQVNDTFGHGVGDGVLMAVAGRLRSVVRPGDTVARLGGDEFVVVCPLAGGEEELARVGERLAEALAPPMVVSGREIQVSASIGLAVGGQESDPDVLLRAADEAMYRAKQQRHERRPPQEAPAEE